MPKNNVQNKEEEFLNIILSEYKKTFSHLDLQISLLAGDSGTVLMQALLFKTTSNIEFKNAFEINLYSLLQSISSPTHKRYATFCNGLAGFGWLLMYCHNIQLIDFDPEDFFEDIDDYLTSVLEEEFELGDWDILHGSIGIALYFLKRNKVKHVEQTIHHLKDNVVALNNGLAWKRIDLNKEHDYLFDFGFAHGNASILYFLTKCYENNILSSICLELISGITNFYLNNIQDLKNIGSFYPSFVPVSRYSEGSNDEFSRLAWCYGDLSVLFSLYKTCKKIGKTSDLERIESMLIATTARKDYDLSNVRDPGVCHGSSGLAIIYRLLFEYTNNAIFYDTYVFWKEKTLDYFSGENEFYDYNKEQFATFKIDGCLRDLLDGLAGMALLFISDYPKEMVNKSPNINEWKELFFLD